MKHDQASVLAHFLDRIYTPGGKPMIPCDPAVLIDSDQVEYAMERKDLLPLVEHWTHGDEIAYLSRKELMDLLVTVFWIGKED